MSESRDPIPETPPASPPNPGGRRSVAAAATTPLEPAAPARDAMPRTRFQRLFHQVGLWPRLHNPLSYRSSLLAALMAFGLIPTILFGVWLDRTFRNVGTMAGVGGLRSLHPSAHRPRRPSGRPSSRGATASGC